jgi:prepilin-type N-terminal cleavage/methylation domain-containing protein
MKEMRAFSLVEISVVLLIVAIFIAAISSGKLLIGKADNISQQKVVESLKSQQYYSETAFEVSAVDIKDNCGANASAEAISDYLYNHIKRSDGGCCSDSTETKSLCCDSSGGNSNGCECSTTGNPQCICGNYDTGDTGEPSCPQ